MLKTRARNLVFAVVASALGDGLIPTAFAIQSFKLDSSGRLLTFVLIALWSAKLISSLALDKIPTPAFPARIMVLSVLRPLPPCGKRCTETSSRYPYAPLIPGTS